ncbi:PilZ domain-containing protein [Marispirochaeta sp.]|jgi:c-di-GMP-binding flagellar brake protein YcgR|uniref:flagellar brake protein n=1 Tax=Marispirochaeta sp. TaxID=2038653 RepID=UPI0029C854EE|nr:PilZ domain-containing protein [Marispirochaeta sp.]
MMLVILLVTLLIFILFLRHAGGGSFPWIHFYTKGKESGFSFREINLLRKVAVHNHLENPISLFWSIRQLDRSIRGVMLRFRTEGRENDESSIRFINKLFEFRKKVELSLPKYTLGLKTTRKLTTHQRLKITLPGIGTYNSSVVENLRRYMAISYPEGPKLPPGASWKGQKINVYFWRAEDAGYVFETKVLDDFIEQKYPILHVSHSDNLIRSQKRRSVRVEVRKPAFLYPLASIAQANENEELTSGLRCRLIDVSEDGAAALVGGRAKVGLAVKLQFMLTSSSIVMCGVVKGVTYNQKKNQSVLHIQAVPLSLRQRNKMLSFVYNIFQEREPKARPRKVPAYG